MSEIPEDIRAKARSIYETNWGVEGGLQGIIARALMEERERCAKIADNWPTSAWRRQATSDKIAAAIRSPIQNEDKT